MHIRDLGNECVNNVGCLDGVYFPDAWKKPQFLSNPLLKAQTTSVTYATDRGILIIS
jgi:hypothetical protein